MRKIRLTKTQGRLLWELQEAGEETAQTLLVTLRVEGVSEAETIASIESLVRLGFLRRDADYLVLTELGYESLAR